MTINPGASIGVLLGVGGTAMSFTGSNVSLTNSGTVDPMLLGQLSILSSGLVVGNTNASIVSVTNNSGGTLAGTSGLLGMNLSGLTGMALTLQNGTGGTSTITNSGVIRSSALLGITAAVGDMPVVAAYGGGQVSFTNNAGATINGRVAFQAPGTPGQGNSFTNAGTITGGVSLGAGATNTFTALTGSSVSAGVGSNGNALGVVGLSGVSIGFAAAGIVDGGLGGANTLVLGRDPGQATGSLTLGNYINFGTLQIQNGDWSLTGATTASSVSLMGGTAIVGGPAPFGSLTIQADGGGIDSSVAGLTLANAIAIGSGGLTGRTSNSYVLSGVLSGTGGLTKTGAGTLTLTATNTYTGDTVINAGTLALGAGGSLASGGAVNLAGAGASFDISASGAAQTIGALSGVAGTAVALGANTLTLGTAANATFAGVITGTGAVVKQGSGSQVLTGANTYAGGTTINAGTLALGAGGSLASGGAVNLAAAGASFDISGAGMSQTIGALSGIAGTAISLGSTGLTLGGATSQTFGGSIGGIGGITKQGAGTQTLTSANTYTGDTLVNAGTLALGAGGSLAATGTVQLGAAGASFDISGAAANQTIGALAGIIGSTVSLGANTLTLGGAADATFGGSITGTGGLVKQGAATQTLTGANAYIGGTTINAGTLALGAGGSLASGGAVNLATAGTSFDISAAGANPTIGALSGVAGTTVALGANTLTLGSAANATVGGSIGGTGGLVKQGTGTQTLTGASTYTGGTTINAGTLALGAGGSLAATGAVHLGAAGAGFDINAAGAGQTIGALSGVAGTTVALGANTLTFGDASNQSFAGSISGTGGLVKQGSGTQTLAGASYSYTGPTSVAGGTLRVESALSNSAVTVASGATLAGSGSIAGAVTVSGGGIVATGSSPGTLTVGSLVLNDTSRLSYELGTPGTVGSGVNDLIEVTGNLKLDGVLDLAPQSGFGNGTYRLFNYGGALTDSGLAFGIVPTGYDFRVDTATAGQINLITTTATLQYWNGTTTTPNGTVHGGSGIWNAAGRNWTNASGSIDTAWNDLKAVFAGPAGGTVTIATDQQIAGLQFGTNGYVLNGPGALLISAAGADLRVDTGLSATINAGIQGGGSLMKTGGGTIVLGAANSYSGGTIINAGTLSVSQNENLGDAASGLTFNGGTLATTASFAMSRTVTLDGGGSVDVAASTQLEIGGSVVGVSSLTKLGTGTLVLSGLNTHSGGTTISAGVLQAGSAAALGTGALTLDGGTFRAGTSFINDFTNVVKIDANGGTIDVNGHVATFSGNIADGSGAGGVLAFVNSDSHIGAAVLGGTNSYSGPTAVGAGVTLTAASNGAFSPNSDVTLAAANAALMADGHAVTVRSLSGSGVVANGSATASGKLTVAPPTGTASFAGTIIDGEPGDRGLALVKAGAGTQILNGTNTYTGGTTITGGTLQIGAGGTGGSIMGDVVNDGTLAFDRSDAVAFAGAISGGGSLAHLGGGTLTLSGSNTYTGGTTIASGTLKVGTGGTTGSITGNVVNNGTLAFDRSGAVSFAGAVSGSGAVAHLGAGSLTLSGSNSYAGGTTIAKGTLTGSAASFGRGTILNNGALVIDQASLATFANAIEGSGSFTKTGAGDLKLTGTSGLTGATTVAAGRLSVNGSLAHSAVTVLSGAELGGNGMLGATTVKSGGTLAPGNSIGTITINGDLVLAPGSTFAAEIGDNGSSDRVIVTGRATLTGSSVTISALDAQTSYQAGQRYALVSATGGVDGGFAAVTSTSAFLDLGLDPRTGEAGITIKVKQSDPAADPAAGTAPVIFQTVAQTRNQYAVALALNTLPQVGGTLALYNSLLMLDAASARTAFGLLSGEVHASVQTALVEESGALRTTAIDRLRSAFGTVGAAPMATLNYGFTADLAPAVKGPMPLPRTDRFAVWGQGYGSWGRIDGDGNASKLTRSTGGLMVGADMAVFDMMRIGVLAGYSRSEFKANGLFASGESDNYHLGVYGGGQWGALGLRTGASYTWHDVSTRRPVGFAGFADRLTGDYQAGTAQIFGELGYRFDLARIALEPFAGLAYVNLHTDGVREIGGVAALSGRGDDTSVGYSTLGLRASTSYMLSGMDLTLRGALAWRHAFGDVNPVATLAFSGSNAFAVSGLPIARNAALVEAGLDFAIGKSTTLGVSYTGQLAKDAQDHAFKANLAVRF
ncbi:autotransporter-associated beta strand repeat-containing protein [Bosea rubneri]|uniref:Autotransporter-associated beta strand repeat-containing protein n=1 Tax=Bosea rubneri TaxID=3075434 RepID=A0ABU3SCI3_9HYPH|nr:autotransporter-associated beta strand repeat-containing protein [Bosea sp. ZW T0_25]MDU0342401.1 autotransporter-associated beta strand repeat-containing protein [Bosea sp. ZW T0_25]